MKLEFTPEGEKALRFDIDDTLKNLKAKYEGHKGSFEDEQHAFLLDEAQVRFDIERNWLEYQSVCDGHNITQAFNMLENCLPKEVSGIKRYIKVTLKEMGWTNSKPIVWDKAWDN